MTGVRIIACSVLHHEITAILPALSKGRRIETVFPDSILHMKPHLLQKHLETLLADGVPSVLIYGDCAPAIDEICSSIPNARYTRIHGVNCTEITVGTERYAQLRKERAFVIFPEWACRWREIFEEGMGFRTAELARLFMQEHRSRFVYIDTALVPIPLRHLEDMKEYFGLPVEIEKAGLNILGENLELCIRELERTDESGRT